MQDPACELPRTPLRDCPKSPSGVHNSALGATETMLFGPFWPPYTGQIHAQSVASTLFGQSRKDNSRKFGDTKAGGAATPQPCTRRRPNTCGLRPGSLPRLGHTTDFLHHVEGVVVDPLFHDFAAGDAVEEVAGKGYLIARRSVAHKLTLVGTFDRPATNHTVTFGYHIVNGDLEIGEAGMVGAHEALETLRATHLSLNSGGTVADEVGGEQLVD